MCNCSQSIPCSSCKSGIPCNCPPDYAVTPLPASCGCCPPGASNYQGPTKNFPNGFCVDARGNQVPSIPCTPCVDNVSTNCVTYNPAEGFPINCFGINAGDTLTTIINKMCLSLKGNIETILSGIGLDSDLGNGFCQLVQNCPSTGGSTTPIIGSITVIFI